MKFVKQNMPDLILLVGIINISIGFFIYSPILGFVITGLLLIGLALYMARGGD